MTDESTEFGHIIRDVKKAVQNAQIGDQDPSLKIKKMELELKTVISRSAGGKIEVNVLPLEVSGDYKKEDINIIKMSLVPGPRPLPPAKLMASVKDELEESIKIIKAVIREAASSAPVFEMDEASVELKFGVSKSGKIEIFATGSGESSRTHSIKLTLGRET